MSTKTPDIAALAQRLERVEQDLRWWKRFGGAISTVLVSVMVLGATSGKAPDEIRAKRFVLEDANGKERATLAAEANGVSRLILLDENGNVRAGLGVLPDGSPGLSLSGKGGKARVSLQVMVPDDTPILTLSDKAGMSRARLDITSDGSSRLVLLGKDGKSRVVLGTGTVEHRPESSLVLFDKDGKVIWQAP